MDDKTAFLLRHPWAAVWHPHQGAWNHYTMSLFQGTRAMRWVYRADNAGRRAAVWRHARAAPPAPPLGKRPQLVFVDIGLHRQAAQSVRMIEWFAGTWPLRILAYEAHPEYAAEARAAMDAAARRSGQPIPITVKDCALVGPEQTASSVKLHLDNEVGKGNSLFAARGERTIDVEARRLSEDLAAEGVDGGREIVVVRMNIEGAELFVLQDLVASGALSRITAFYGMWDDLFKIDAKQDAALRRLCRRHRVRTFTFNDRDLVRPGVAPPFWCSARRSSART